MRTGTAQRVLVFPRVRNVERVTAAVAFEQALKSLKSFHDRREILALEIGPIVIVYGRIDLPLFSQGLRDRPFEGRLPFINFRRLRARTAPTLGRGLCLLVEVAKRLDRCWKKITQFVSTVAAIFHAPAQARAPFRCLIF